MKRHVSADQTLDVMFHEFGGQVPLDERDELLERLGISEATLKAHIRELNDEGCAWQREGDLFVTIHGAETARLRGSVQAHRTARVPAQFRHRPLRGSVEAMRMAARVA